MVIMDDDDDGDNDGVDDGASIMTLMMPFKTTFVMHDDVNAKNEIGAEDDPYEAKTLQV